MEHRSNKGTTNNDNTRDRQQKKASKKKAQMKNIYGENPSAKRKKNIEIK